MTLLSLFAVIKKPNEVLGLKAGRRTENMIFVKFISVAWGKWKITEKLLFVFNLRIRKESATWLR